MGAAMDGCGNAAFVAAVLTGLALVLGRARLNSVMLPLGARAPFDYGGQQRWDVCQPNEGHRV